MYFKNNFDISKRNNVVCNYINIFLKRKCTSARLEMLDVDMNEVEESSNKTKVYVWGFNQTGALGMKSNETHFLYPKKLNFFEKHNVTSAATGCGFTAFVVNEDGNDKLYGTGLNTDFQIGQYQLDNKYNPLDFVFEPQSITLPINATNRRILKLAAGRAHMLVLTDDGLFTFGDNGYGQCGVAQNDHDINFIYDINNERIVDVEAGLDHSLAITEGGKVYSCGWGADGQTGLEHYKSVSKFTRVMGDIKGKFIVKIVCASDTVLALSDKGEIFGWGNNEYGQLNTSSKCQWNRPAVIKFCQYIGKIKDLAAGGTFCMALNERRDIYVWGYGLLGINPNAIQIPTPMKLPYTCFGLNDFSSHIRIESVASGLFNMAALSATGDLYMWGRNSNGCLGLGSNKSQYFPLKVGLKRHVKKIFCGVNHTVALCF